MKPEGDSPAGRISNKCQPFDMLARFGENLRLKGLAVEGDLGR